MDRERIWWIVDWWLKRSIDQPLVNWGWPLVAGQKIHSISPCSSFLVLLCVNFSENVGLLIYYYLSFSSFLLVPISSPFLILSLPISPHRLSVFFVFLFLPFITFSYVFFPTVIISLNSLQYLIPYFYYLFRFLLFFCYYLSHFPFPLLIISPYLRLYLF